MSILLHFLHELYYVLPHFSNWISLYVTADNCNQAEMTYWALSGARLEERLSNC